jgi:hypothetical protein
MTKLSMAPCFAAVERCLVSNQLAVMVYLCGCCVMARLIAPRRVWVFLSVSKICHWYPTSFFGYGETDSLVLRYQSVGSRILFLSLRSCLESKVTEWIEGLESLTTQFWIVRDSNPLILSITLYLKQKIAKLGSDWASNCALVVAMNSFKLAWLNFIRIASELAFFFTERDVDILPFLETLSCIRTSLIR